MVLLTAVIHSKKDYDLVSDDGYDSQVPLHNDDAFKTGISFQSKYIGTLDVPRPTTKIEIVAAMRRIRYEFKAKAIKKRKVNVVVSLDGVKVHLRKKHKKNQWQLEESRHLLLQHAIYRIFYVSHDSQDLKIWSYIARDGATNVFKCNVFKTYKKDQAMLVVRTIGQAFEVCHKLTGSINTDDNSDNGKVLQDPSSKDDEAEGQTTPTNDPLSGSHATDPTRSTMSLPLNDPSTPQRPKLPAMGGTIVSPLPTPVVLSDDTPSRCLPLSLHHRAQLLQQQLEQQTQQTQIAIAHAHLLKDQLAAETAARIEAQARSHQLLLNNRDLLNHMETLLAQVRALELTAAGLPITDSDDSPPHIPDLPDATTPLCGPVFITDQDGVSPTINVPDIDMFENKKVTEDALSPDSGHRDMSSDSLSSAAGLHHQIFLSKSVSESPEIVPGAVSGAFGELYEDGSSRLENGNTPQEICEQYHKFVLMNGAMARPAQFDKLSPVLPHSHFRYSVPEELLNKSDIPAAQCQNSGKTLDQFHYKKSLVSATGSVSAKRSESMPLYPRDILPEATSISRGDASPDTDDRIDGVHYDVIDKRCRTELEQFAETNSYTGADASSVIYDEIVDSSLTRPVEGHGPSLQNSSIRKLKNSFAEASARRSVVINHVTESPRRSKGMNFSIQSHIFTPLRSSRPVSDTFTREN